MFALAAWNAYLISENENIIMTMLAAILHKHLQTVCRAYSCRIPTSPPPPHTHTLPPTTHTQALYVSVQSFVWADIHM